MGRLTKNSFLFSMSLVLLLVVGCSKKEEGKTKALKELHSIYSDGIISECELDGSIVYKAGFDNEFSGNVLYNLSTEVIGSCYYGCFTVPDEICSDVENCEVVYCISGNNWGIEATDKYNLGFKR